MKPDSHDGGATVNADESAGLTDILRARIDTLIADLYAARAELAGFRAECDAVGIPYDPTGLVRHHQGNAGATVAFQELRKQLELTQERDATRAELAALQERPKAYQIDGESVHTVITTAQYEALRRVVDAEIELADYRLSTRNDFSSDAAKHYFALEKARDAALAAYRAEYDGTVIQYEH